VTAETLARPAPVAVCQTVREAVEAPSWLRLAAFVTASAVLAFGVVGLALAINGWYRAALAFAVGGVVWAGLVALARPAFASRPGGVSRRAHVYAAIGVIAIVAITGWNVAHASQHVLIDRDGGAYENAGRWIARDGSLSVHPRVGPFATEPTIGFDSIAVFQMPDGSLSFQFAHLLPSILAEAYAIAGDPGMFHTPELLGGVALLAFFVLAWRLLREPLFALSAMLALGLIIPQVSFARDSYSEIPSQILLFTALWLLTSPTVLPRWRLAFIAGCFIGALEAARIDSIVFLIGIPVVCAIAWLRAPRDDRRAVAFSIGALVAGILPGVTLGWIDVARHSGLYYASLAGDVHSLALATVLSAAASMAIVLAWRPASPALRRLPWRPLSAAAGALVTAGGFAVWAFRPRVQHILGDARAITGLQQAEHLTVDPTRLYFERSMSWMSWYVGPVTLAAALVGAGLLLTALIRGHRLRTLPALAVLVPGTMLYLYKAHAVPDHVWVTRRLLVSAFPLLILLALGTAAWLASRRAATGSQADARVVRTARAGGVALAVLAVAYPLWALRPVGSMAEESGYLGVVDDVCRVVGPHAAIVVLETAITDSTDDWIPQAFRSWCGADVGVSRGSADPDVLRRLAGEWKAEGRQLFVASTSRDYVVQVLPDASIISTREAVDTKLLMPTLSHRPDSYTTQSFSMVVAPVATQ
jgi:hypothetical protein